MSSSDDEPHSPLLGAGSFKDPPPQLESESEEDSDDDDEMPLQLFNFYAEKNGFTSCLGALYGDNILSLPFTFPCQLSKWAHIASEPQCLRRKTLPNSPGRLVSDRIMHC
jgi:hypothetical protein